MEVDAAVVVIALASILGMAACVFIHYREKARTHGLLGREHLPPHRLDSVHMVEISQHGPGVSADKKEHTAEHAAAI